MSLMKVCVIGCNGQLGKSLIKIIGINKPEKKFKFVFLSRKELDLNDDKNIDQFFSKNFFDIIINCAAYTLVDRAEEEKDIANQINNLAAKRIAIAANNNNSKLIHISTDYVFDGSSNKDYVEDDIVNPINIYGVTKEAGEKSVLSAMQSNALIIRTSWVYSEFGNNFVKTMLKIGSKNKDIQVINDQYGSPTYASDLAESIYLIIQKPYFQNKKFQSEIFHYSNKGNISWHQFAEKIFEFAKINCKVLPIQSYEYKTSAKRPLNSCMNKKKFIDTFNIPINKWDLSLKRCIKILEKNL